MIYTLQHRLTPTLTGEWILINDYSTLEQAMSTANYIANVELVWRHIKRYAQYEAESGMDQFRITYWGERDRWPGRRHIRVLPERAKWHGRAQIHHSEDATMSELDRVVALAKRGDYVVLDTETTGLHDGEICQIAIINDAGEVLLNTLVKTVFPIPPDAMAIHGITNEMVADAPGWVDIVRRVRGLVEGRDVVVYNAVYDRKMMHQASEKAGIPKIDWKLLSRWHCAMEAFAQHHGEWNSWHGSYTWKSLAFAASALGVEQQGAHDALADCQATLAVVKALAAQQK